MSVNLLAASLCLLSIATAGPAFCVDDPGIFGSVQVAGAAKKAAKAMKKGSYGEAETEYRALLGKDDDFYFGFYESSRKLNHWDQAALALEQLFEKRPAFRDQLTLEYGEALCQLNRYDEAEPQLKKALTKLTEPSVVSAKLRTLYAKSDPPEDVPTVGPTQVWVEPSTPVVPPRYVVDAEEINEDTEKVLSLTNAFLKSESIVIAEFKGFEADSHVGYFDPPTAMYRIESVLKGPPLNRSLPLRYEFHRKLASDAKPENWKWSVDLMPAKGSKWIIFISNAVPVAGRFETFHGAYGRQELNENNLDSVHRIIEEHQGQAK